MVRLVRYEQLELGLFVSGSVLLSNDADAAADDDDLYFIAGIRTYCDKTVLQLF